MDDLHSAVHGVAAAVVSVAEERLRETRGDRFKASDQIVDDVRKELQACGLGICGRMVLRCLLGHRRKVGA